MWNVDWEKDSTTPQLWTVQGMRRIVLAQGRERFGPPDARTQKAITRIYDVECLERLAVRLLKVANWKELLAEVESQGLPPRWRSEHPGRPAWLAETSRWLFAASPRGTPPCASPGRPGCPRGGRRWCRSAP